MKVNIQEMNGITYEIIGLQSNDKLSKLKSLVQMKCGVPVQEQNLMYMGQILDNGDATLSALGLEDGCKLCLVYRSVGGVGVEKMNAVQFSGLIISG